MRGVAHLDSDYLFLTLMDILTTLTTDASSETGNQKKETTIAVYLILRSCFDTPHSLIVTDGCCYFEPGGRHCLVFDCLMCIIPLFIGYVYTRARARARAKDRGGWCLYCTKQVNVAITLIPSIHGVLVCRCDRARSRRQTPNSVDERGRGLSQ